jgi:hypothetical protein
MDHSRHFVLARPGASLGHDHSEHLIPGCTPHSRMRPEAGIGSRLRESDAQLLSLLGPRGYGAEEHIGDICPRGWTMG